MPTRGRPVSQYMAPRSRSSSRTSYTSSRPTAHRSHSNSHSHSHSHPHSHSHREHRPRHEHEHEHEHRDRRDSSGNSHHRPGLLKTSAGLIAGLGVAAVVAHKVWPKGILHSESDESESRREHHHHSHSHSHSHNHRSQSHDHDGGHGHHSEHRRHSHNHERRPSDAERMLHRAHSMRGSGTHADGDVVYYEEVAPARRGGRLLEARSFERTSQGERHRLEQLPYPDKPYPSELLYEPGRRRASISAMAH